MFIRYLLIVVASCLFAATPALAQTLRVGRDLCTAVTAIGAPAETADTLTFRCDRVPANYQRGTLWLRYHAVRRLDDSMILMMHQTRFDTARVWFDYADGRRIERSVRRGDYANKWRIGGQILLQAPGRRAPLTTVTIAIERLASHHLLRVRFMDADAAGLNVSFASALVGGALTLLLLGAIYTICLAVVVRRQFLAWHGAWAGCVFVWGTLWSQVGLIFVPSIAGTTTSQICTLLACLAIAAATFSAATSFADIAVPRWVRRFLALIGALIALTSIPAARATGESLDLIDPILSVLTLTDLGAVTMCLAVAIWRGSREARDLAGAWAAPITALALTTIVDVSEWPLGGGAQILVLFACAFQTVWLSVAITQRLSAWKMERDAARAAESELGELASRDPLTGLLNRRGFLDQARTLLADDAAADLPSGLLVIDIDHFKPINDVFGHEVGDAVLSRVAQCLRRWEGPRRIAGRWGGEEFLVGTIGLTPHELHGLAERIRADLGLCDHGEVTLARAVTVSIGAAHGPAGTPFDMLYTPADRALFEAKRMGRDRVVMGGESRAPHVLPGRIAYELTLPADPVSTSREVH